MDEFTIYCTEEQVKKYLKLGGSIKIKYFDRYTPTCTEQRYLIHIDYYWHIIPTAEQMFGWLMKQGVLMRVDPINGMNYYWLLATKELTEEPDKYSWVTQYVTPGYKEIPDYNEAVLSAIDAGLDYLINHKNES